MIPEIHGPDHKSMFNGVHGPGPGLRGPDSV